MTRKWRGHIEEIDGDTVIARYEPDAAPAEIWELDLDKVPEDMRFVGALFDVENAPNLRWCRERWTQEDIDRAREAAKELCAVFLDKESK